MFEGVVEMVDYASSTFAFVKAYVMGATQTVRLVSSYGFYSNPPIDSHIQLFCGDDLDNAFGIADDTNNRPKDLKSNEIYVYNTQTKAGIKLHADGSVTIYGPKDITVKSDEGVNILTTQDTTITAQTQAVVTSPNIILNGNVTMGSDSVGVGKGVARVDDQVEVYVTGGSSAGTWYGKIISGSAIATSS